MDMFICEKIDLRKFNEILDQLIIDYNSFVYKGYFKEKIYRSAFLYPILVDINSNICVEYMQHLNFDLTKEERLIYSRKDYIRNYEYDLPDIDPKLLDYQRDSILESFVNKEFEKIESFETKPNWWNSVENQNQISIEELHDKILLIESEDNILPLEIYDIIKNLFNAKRVIL